MYKLPVTKIEEYKEGDKVTFKIITLSNKKNEFSFQTGQFVMISMEDYKRWDKPKEQYWTAMSIASSHLDKDHVEFCMEIKETEGFSKHLGDSLKVGDHLFLKEPMGKFTIKDMKKDMIFVGTGSGVAPVMGMIRTLVKSGYKKNFKLFFGFRYCGDCLYGEELEKYAKELPNFEFVSVCSRDDTWKGARGHIQEHMESCDFKSPDDTHVYMCGNPKMVMSVKEILQKKGFKKENLFQEQWA
ncbi:MAG: FAD-binding oxidoreductase [Candidatus Aenigmatarchaeota archaeon]